MIFSEVMIRKIVLGVIITKVSISWTPNNIKLGLCATVMQPIETHDYHFGGICLRVLLVKVSSVVLSI